MKTVEEIQTKNTISRCSRKMVRALLKSVHDEDLKKLENFLKIPNEKYNKSDDIGNVLSSEHILTTPQGDFKIVRKPGEKFVTFSRVEK